MTHAKNKVEWCLKKAEHESRKHRGLRKITPDLETARAHIGKAEHNLVVMDYLMAGGFNDWAIHAAFYAQYHCLLALLQQHGYESRNQECTFAAIEHLIEQGRLDFETADLHQIFDAAQSDRLDAADIVELRERFQYGIETRYETARIQVLLAQTKKILEKTKALLVS